MSSFTFEPVELDDFDKILGTTSTEVSSVALGGKILGCSDEWFAPASDLLKVSRRSIDAMKMMTDLLSNLRRSALHLV